MKRILPIIILGFCGFLHAQNLVPNPSFETYTVCPTSAGAFAGVANWFVVPTHNGSPDFHHVCGSTTFGVPSNVFGNQNARTGSGYIGFVTHFGSGNFREYLEVQLPTPMVSGTSYDVSAYLSLSDGSGWGTDGFGFYFSTGQVSGSGTNQPLPLTPQVANPNNNYITSKVNWTPVTGTFTATANYSYLVIGNFKNDATTNYQVQSGWSWNYTYLDDVSVIPTVIFSADLIQFGGVLNDQTAILDWSTSSENGTHARELQRSYGDAANFETIATITAEGNANSGAEYNYNDSEFDPNQLNYYRLREFDANGGGGYSQAVLLKAEGFQPEAKLHLYPNPIASGTDLQLQLEAGVAMDIDWTIADMQGREVVNGEFSSYAEMHQEALAIGELSSGTYILNLNGARFHKHALFLVK